MKNSKLEFCKINKNMKCNNCGNCVFSINKNVYNTYYKESNSKDHSYGIACDLGSTNLCLRLYDLNTKELAGKCSLENPQRLYGKDIITRETYALNGEKEQKILYQLLMDGINNCINMLLSNCNIVRASVTKAVFCGNTAMSHFFLNRSIKGLTETPFRPAFTGSVYINATDSDVKIAPDGKVFLLQNLGGHVGSDITAGLLNGILYENKETIIYVDIGTNGEIVLKHKGRYIVTSVAAGPVFEGAGITFGTNAVKGAISEVKIGRKLDLKTIEDGEPAGICGSGIVSLISNMLKSGIIDKKGTIYDPDYLVRRYMSKDIIDRVEEENNSYKFYLTEKIFISQEDIRSFQLAKSAIRTGINILLKEKELNPSDVDKVVLTGAMGTNLDISDLVSVGMLPEEFAEKTICIKDGAIEGLSKILLDNESIKRAEHIAANTENLFLNEKENFQDEYIHNMNF